MNYIMNYSDVLKAVQQASLFDLYRFSVAIHNELENPLRIKDIRNQFDIGDTIHYFDAKENMSKAGVVVEKKFKYVLMRAPNDHKLWKIPYYLLNLQNVNTDIRATGQEKLSKNNLKVGDLVGFNHNGKIIVGRIIRRNFKTVTLLTMNHARWRVSYAVLFRTIDAEFEKAFNEEYLRLAQVDEY
jgi:hypothetical protein